jgi:Ca2+-binding EF-hand superfamily protein
MAALAMISPAFADHREGERNWLPRFRGMDRNGDGAISAQEWRGNRQTFNNQDWNGDGVISGRELTEDRQSYRGSADRTMDRRDERFRSLDRNGDGVIQSTEWAGDAQMFHRLDRDGNSRVTYDEFTERDSGSMSGSRSSQFSHMDTNGNGVIDGPEWKDDPQVFHSMDTNGNSVIDRHEFLGRDYRNNRGSADRDDDEDDYFNRRRR